MGGGSGANWDAGHRAAWMAEGWINKQLDNSSTLHRGVRISFTIRHAHGRKQHHGKDHFEKALSRDPEDATAWFNLGTVGGGEVDGQRYFEKECFEKVLSLNPEHFLAWLMLGSMGGGEVG